MVVVNGESYARPKDAPLDLDKSSVVDVVDGIEDIDADTGDVTVCARALPTPKLPAPPVVAHQNVSHFLHRSWCPYCVTLSIARNLLTVDAAYLFCMLIIAFLETLMMSRASP